MNIKYEDIDYESLGILLTERRHSLAITLTQLSELLGISRQSLQMMMRGSRRMSPKHLTPMLDYFEISESEVPLKNDTQVVLKGKLFTLK